MSWSLADARFLLERALGLARRGATSLRSRGLRASLQRAADVLRPAPRPPGAGLRFPDDAGVPSRVPSSASPLASIVVPVHGHLGHTLACLRALAAWPPEAPVEIIVVDDGSPDDTPRVLPAIPGLRYHQREGNGGFIAACNDGAALARGEFLVFLNNDTVPQPGWLDALLATFAQVPDAGLAGAQLLYPDGRLQEAGGVVFDDGSGPVLDASEASDQADRAKPPRRSASTSASAPKSTPVWSVRYTIRSTSCGVLVKAIASGGSGGSACGTEATWSC